VASDVVDPHEAVSEDCGMTGGLENVNFIYLYVRTQVFRDRVLRNVRRDE